MSAGLAGEVFESNFAGVLNSRGQRRMIGLTQGKEPLHDKSARDFQKVKAVLQRTVSCSYSPTNRYHFQHRYLPLHKHEVPTSLITYKLIRFQTSIPSHTWAQNELVAMLDTMMEEMKDFLENHDSTCHRADRYYFKLRYIHTIMLVSQQFQASIPSCIQMSTKWAVCYVGCCGEENRFLWRTMASACHHTCRQI